MYTGSDGPVYAVASEVERELHSTQDSAIKTMQLQLRSLDQGSRLDTITKLRKCNVV